MIAATTPGTGPVAGRPRPEPPPPGRLAELSHVQRLLAASAGRRRL